MGMGQTVPDGKRPVSTTESKVFMSMKPVSGE